MRTVKSNLKGFDCKGDLQRDEDGNILIEDMGYGERAIAVAMENPNATIIAKVQNEERCEIATIAAKDFVENIKFYI